MKKYNKICDILLWSPLIMNFIIVIILFNMFFNYSGKKLSLDYLDAYMSRILWMNFCVHIIYFIALYFFVKKFLSGNVNKKRYVSTIIITSLFVLISGFLWIKIMTIIIAIYLTIQALSLKIVTKENEAIK